jgi:hypothetical protein
VRDDDSYVVGEGDRDDGREAKLGLVSPGMDECSRGSGGREDEPVPVSGVEMQRLAGDAETCSGREGGVRAERGDGGKRASSWRGRASELVRRRTGSSRGSASVESRPFGPP